MSHQPDNIFAGTQVAKRSEMSWTDADAWRKDLHQDFERALTETKLPERPDYEAANRFLFKARKGVVN